MENEFTPLARAHTNSSAHAHTLSYTHRQWVTGNWKLIEFKPAILRATLFFNCKRRFFRTGFRFKRATSRLIHREWESENHVEPVPTPRSQQPAQKREKVGSTRGGFCFCFGASFVLVRAVLSRAKGGKRLILRVAATTTTTTRVDWVASRAGRFGWEGRDLAKEDTF